MQNVSICWKKMEERSLVLLSQSGNDLAFSELIRRNHATCMRLAFSILHDRSDAEDEVQNALWKAFEHIGQFNQEAKFSTWLTRIVVNQCLMRLRQTRRAKMLYLEDAVVGSDDQTALDLPDQSETPEAALGKREVSAVVKREISRIPPLLRNVFLLREVQDLPMADVAARLGISLAAAKSRLLRARLELRTRLEKHEGRLGVATLTA